MGALDWIARAGFGHDAFSMANAGPKSTGQDFKLTYYHVILHNIRYQRRIPGMDPIGAG